MQKRQKEPLVFVGLLCLITLTESATVRRTRSPVAIPVGVILDSDSSLGNVALICTNIALQDFYSTHHSYATRLQLHFRDSGNDLLTTDSAAWDLIINETVHAIVGPQNSEQARFVVELGNKYDVPVIWFSPSAGPSLLPPRSPFFINSNSTRSHCLQFKAIAAIIEAYNWQSVIPIYEEPEFGNDLIPCLTYALLDMDARVPYKSFISQNSSDSQITQELKKIKRKRTYVFLVHMTLDLGSRLVEQAQKEGMMSEGYAWILTQGLSSVMDPEPIDIKVKGFMDGALGVKPSLVVSDKTKLERVSLARSLLKYNKTLSLYGLWAYDTITALAKAVENASLVNSNESRVDLREAIKDTNFPGLSGNFSLRQGLLQPSQEVVVYNIVDQKERIIGYWSPERGLHQNRSGIGEPARKFKLRDPIWPGHTVKRPPKMKIGIPKTHFTEFVDVSDMPPTGFAVDVFKKVVDVLPFPLPYEFVPLNNINPYEDLLCQITDKNVDVIIGDITVVENRTKCIDFTMPYLDSSVAMGIKVGYDPKSEWILLKPFDQDLWLILGGIIVGATVIIIILERKGKDDDESKFEHFVRNPFLIYMSDVEDLKSGKSKWVVIVVTFLLGIAVQIYTANLTSILTGRTMAKPSPWKDLKEIKRNNVSVGYQSNSWVKDLLINQIGLKTDHLKPLGSLEEYEKALSKGAKNGGVDVIVDETPYLRLLLWKCPSCKMTGPIYKAGGFAFAFPKNSTLVSSFSTAILHVTQNVKTTGRDMKRTISLLATIDKSEYKSQVEWRSLTKDDFGGLFPIVYSVLALFFGLSILKVPCMADWLRSTSIYRSIDLWWLSISLSLSLWWHSLSLSLSLWWLRSYIRW